MMTILSTSSAQDPDPLRLEFAEGRVVCLIKTDDKEVPDIVGAVLPIAMRCVLEEIGAPPEPATLTIRLEKPPRFYKRSKALMPVEALAVQDGDEIRLHPGSDPLKLAFRLGHELSHWLVYKQHPARPPLWLDEGLANRMGSAAAEAAARPLSQTIERPPPGNIAKHLEPLDALLVRTTYPRKPLEVAAFYWQAETLVDALRDKLGRDAFRDYLGLLSAPEQPPWDAPLRETWYFNDADFQWLSERILNAP